MEFKSIDGSFIINGEGNLKNVPDSRSTIFKDRKLSFTEKNQLMRFFKLIQGHLEAAVSADSGDSKKSKSISEKDLESSFVEFLSKTGVSPKLKSFGSNSLSLSALANSSDLLVSFFRIVLYAIAMKDYDQENGDANKSVLRQKTVLIDWPLSLIRWQISAPKAAICVIVAQIGNFGESLIDASLQEKEGFRWLTNDVVNVINISLGSMLPFLMQKIIPQLVSSGLDADQRYAKFDERKRKRMESNRESARRTFQGKSGIGVETSARHSSS